MADFFDRLVARTVPGVAMPEGEALVRPRLPHLFERGEVADMSAAEPLTWPTRVGSPGEVTVAPVAASRPVERQRVEHEEHVVRRAQDDASVPVSRKADPGGRGDPGVTTPAAVVRPVVRTPVVPPPSRPAAQEVVPPVWTVRTPDAVGELVPPTAPPPGVVPPQWTDGRRAGPSFGRRAPARQPEQTVRVSIGRLEVTASAARREPERARPGRPEPAVSLERFLDREGGRR
ncbi:hypothetical protein [Streptoalloteichus hindustanus]|uniref:Uncharacterized protein n=1 Tax=Streptoalloteichus hindustanus TaxID=2017 RepID=A0A1M4YW74_STRHI|nr:hypothetical protein [Streptoalloteichus hindustanus]SHF09586.1 hypothetical protein SAMN05444320_102494 [Streptoalloteichus hindustanus]